MSNFERERMTGFDTLCELSEKIYRVKHRLQTDANERLGKLMDGYADPSSMPPFDEDMHALYDQIRRLEILEDVNNAFMAADDLCFGVDFGKTDADDLRSIEFTEKVTEGRFPVTMLSASVARIGAEIVSLKDSVYARLSTEYQINCLRRKALLLDCPISSLTVGSEKVVAVHLPDATDRAFHAQFEVFGDSVCGHFIESFHVIGADTVDNLIEDRHTWFESIPKDTCYRDAWKEMCIRVERMTPSTGIRSTHSFITPSLAL